MVVRPGVIGDRPYQYNPGGRAWSIPPPRKRSLKDLVSPDAPVDQAAPPRGGRWRLAAGVFLVTLAMYVLTANGHLQGQDQEYYYRMAQSLALKRSFAV